MLPDYINIYLYNKKNLSTAKELMNLSARVRSTGITEDILDDLTDITKSDSVRHKFTNIKDSIIERYENAEYSVGIPTGVNFIDEMTGGVHKGEVTSIAGFAGHCKTTFAINISYSALTLNNNVLYLSLEVPSESIYFDFISRHSNNSKFKMRVPHYDLKKRRLKPDAWEYVKTEIIPDFNNISGRCYIIDETELDNYSQYTLEAKFREIDRLAEEETGHRNRCSSN